MQSDSPVLLCVHIRFCCRIARVRRPRVRDSESRNGTYARTYPANRAHDAILERVSERPDLTAEALAYARVAMAGSPLVREGSRGRSELTECERVHMCPTPTLRGSSIPYVRASIQRAADISGRSVLDVDVVGSYGCGVMVSMFRLRARSSPSCDICPV